MCACEIKLKYSTHTSGTLLRKDSNWCMQIQLFSYLQSYTVAYKQHFFLSYRMLNIPCLFRILFFLSETPACPKIGKEIISCVLTTERCGMTTTCFIIEWNLYAKRIIQLLCGISLKVVTWCQNVFQKGSHNIWLTNRNENSEERLLDM